MSKWSYIVGNQKHLFPTLYAEGLNEAGPIPTSKNISPSLDKEHLKMTQLDKWWKWSLKVKVVFPVVFANDVEISDTENLRHHRYLFFQDFSTLVPAF